MSTFVDTPYSLRVERLRESIRALGSCVVAYSGGVDSSVVLAIARQELGVRALAVIGQSATYAGSELELSDSVA